MTFYHDVRIDRPGLKRVRFLVWRPELSSSGCLESTFLDNMAEIHRLPPGTSFTEALRQTASRPETEVVACIRNPRLVLDNRLPRRVSTALAKLEGLRTWALASAGGLGLREERCLALYASERPGFPTTGAITPIVDTMPDFTLVHAPFAAEVLMGIKDPSDAALETILILEGYAAGRPSVFVPRLTAGIAGDLTSRDLTRFATQISNHFTPHWTGQRVATLMGPVTIGADTPQKAAPAPHEDGLVSQKISGCIDQDCATVGISVVTRTRFTRPHLIRRLLTSLSRARHPKFPVEVVLSSDCDPETGDARLCELQADFPHLEVRLTTQPADGPSRVSNLRHGVLAARNDYTVIMDDDDYVDLLAFAPLESAFFGGRRPIIVTRADTHHETWEMTPAGRAILAHRQPGETYLPHRWRHMFDGVNKLPVCALLTPTEFLKRRVESWPCENDLSEDYALFLHLLTAPDLPEIYESPEVFSHISLRGTDQSVGMADRRPWVRDISGHLDSLVNGRNAAGPGQWQLLAGGVGPAASGEPSRADADLRSALDASERQCRLLERERAHLLARLEAMQEASV